MTMHRVLSRNGANRPILRLIRGFERQDHQGFYLELEPCPYGDIWDLTNFYADNNNFKKCL